ncbi:MAG: hypothetical protein WAN65_06965, partial [Candidatus Sulfotelmatobacter sp.]
IEILELSYSHSINARLADDSMVLTAVYTAAILWIGEKLNVEVLATGSRPLLGTQLLVGHDVHIQFVEGGLVTIDTL